MIKVYFPPGCYGTYFARCLYNYTNLRTEPFAEFSVDDNGSSHQHRRDTHAHTLIKEGHIHTLCAEQDDTIITIFPCPDHELDYYNNQFFKNQKGQLIRYVLAHLSKQDAQTKLKEQWGYNGELDETVPQWIMREWCSFWLSDTLQSGYNILQYLELDSVATTNTLEIFDQFLETFVRITHALGLTITVDSDIINKQHKDFLNAQKFHNSQQRCDQYVQDVIAGNNNTMAIHSIFDEAYIQYRLRKHNLEIRCEGLNTFPNTTNELKLLTYENSNNRY